MESEVNISEKLKHLRKRSKYTVAIIAEALGIKIARYQHYEQGRAMPPLQMLIKIATVYNLTVDELIGNSKPQASKIEENYRRATPEDRRIVDFILKINC